jgi:hypothetical protein
LLALGCASWPKLGSDGQWAEIFANADITVVPLAPANYGVLVTWSDVFRSRFEGAALKRIALTIGGVMQRGEAVVTRNGLEGGAALGPHIRSACTAAKTATLVIDLKPDLSVAELARRLEKRRGSDTMTNHLRKAAHLDPVAVGLLCETELPEGAEALAVRIKALPLIVTGLESIERGHFNRWGRQLGRFGSSFDDQGQTRHLRCGRDARLGGADRRLFAAGFVRDSGPRRKWFACLDRGARITTIESASRGFSFHCPPSLQKCHPPIDQEIISYLRGRTGFSGECFTLMYAAVGGSR